MYVLAMFHRLGRRIVVPSTDEERTALWINRRRLPHGAAAVLVCLSTVVRHVEGLPKHRAVSSVERHDAAAEAAARIRGIRRQSFFVRRNTDVNNPVEHNRGTSNDGCWMRLHVPNPSEFSCSSVNCDHICTSVRFLRTENVSDNQLVVIYRRTNTRNSTGNAVVVGDLVRPDETATVLINGEQVAGPIGEVDCVTGHGRSGRNISTGSEYPFWFQALDVVGTD